jgi:hypothetical protein
MTQGRGGRARGESEVNNIDDPGDAIGSAVGGAAGGGGGERATGTPNAVYDLSSVLFHALQGGASHDAYIEDAQRQGDEELTEFFRRVREEDRDRAAEARLLLAERTPIAARTVVSTAPGVAATQGLEPDVSLGTQPSGGLPGTEPRAEGASPGDARRTYAVTEMPDEDLTPPEDVVAPDAPGPPEAPSKAEAGQPPRTERVGPLSGEGDVQPTRTEEVASPRPEPSDDFPGTEPVEGEDPTASSGEVPPPPEGEPPARAGEVPMAEGVPPPRAEEIPTVTQTQASPRDATSLMPGGIPHEGIVPPPPPPPRGTGESPTAEEERAGQKEEDKGLIDRVIDKLTGEEEQRGKRTDRPGRR